jgi:hypothetical protein
VEEVAEHEAVADEAVHGCNSRSRNFQTSKLSSSSRR